MLSLLTITPSFITLCSSLSIHFPFSFNFITEKSSFCIHTLNNHGILLLRVSGPSEKVFYVLYCVIDKNVCWHQILNGCKYDDMYSLCLDLSYWQVNFDRHLISKLICNSKEEKWLLIHQR